MGRKKNYQEEDVLSKGLELFWRKGYDNISIDELVQYTGLNRDSMYKVFGNKQAFFEKVVQCYIDWVFTDGPGHYLGSHQGIEAIELFIQSSIDTVDERGCFLLNTDVHYQQYPDSLKQCIDQYKHKLKTAFMGHLSLTNMNKKQAEEACMILIAFFVGAISIQKRQDKRKELKRALKRLINTVAVA